MIGYDRARLSMLHRFLKIAALACFAAFFSFPATSSAQVVTFAKVATVPVAGTSPRSVAAADFNRDGKPDFAVANFGNKTVVVQRGNGNGTFTQTASIGLPTAP